MLVMLNAERTVFIWRFIAMDLADCTLCPRNCHADRTVNRMAYFIADQKTGSRISGSLGYCGQTSDITAARASLHMWEEPCISGQSGSGTVFFSGCNMRCVFCQNHHISAGQAGKIISVARLSEIFLELQAKHACNINLVTPTHFVPQIIRALETARSDGLTIPVVYNTSAYEKVETLKALEGLVDIYLPDLKYYSPSLSRKYSSAGDYFTYASAAISEMVRQTGQPLFFTENNNPALPEDCAEPLMKKGVIVRHLALPGCAEDSKAILRYLYHTYGDKIYISIMNQYTPLPQFLDIKSYPELDRTLTAREYDELVDYAISLGIENGFIQEGGTCSDSFIPSFDYTGL